MSSSSSFSITNKKYIYIYVFTSFNLLIISSASKLLLSAFIQ